jgi:hypothetical protein
MAKFVNNLDFNGNQALNLKLQHIAGSIAATADNNGKMYYNSSTGNVEVVSNATVKPLSLGGSYTLPKATASSLGGVMVPSTSKLKVDTSGNIDLQDTVAAKVNSAIQGVKVNGTIQTPDGNQHIELGDVVVAVGGKIPQTYLPSYVDDVIEVADKTALEALTDQEQGKIYITTDNNTQYRWSGTTWIELSKSMDIATEDEAKAGVDDAKMMTAAKVKTAIENLSPCRKFTADVGDGTTLQYTFAHGLGTADLVVLLREVATGEVVLADIVVDATNVQITFSAVPTASQYRLTVIG